MDALKQEILELLNRNLVISPEVREELVQNLESLSEPKIKKILVILRDADQKQTQALEEILKEDPYFFHKLEHVILETMEDEFEKQEIIEHEVAEKELENDLANFSKK